MPARPETIPQRGDGSDAERPERFAQLDGVLIRRVARRDGSLVETPIGPADARLRQPALLHARADRLLLRASRLAVAPVERPRVRIADLFCGIGALSLGALEAARALGMRGEIVLAADSDQAPLDVYQSSLEPGPGVARCLDLQVALGGTGSVQLDAERALLRTVPKDVDVLVAGPPCQGHSRLNNYTRHDDPRNDLYGCVARFVELRKPRLVIIENVDTITSDQRGAVFAARTRLEAIGYQATEGTVPLHRLGVAQTRRRHLLVATRADQRKLVVDDVVSDYAVERPELRTVDWAIGDLTEGVSGFDRASAPSADNVARLRWFAENPGRRDLPNSERPDCHRLPKVQADGSVREHSYRSMYGRLYPDRPAQTITSGFGSMGQGRYVHPHELRTITPHEAARLQFVPDFYDFSGVQGRGQLARMLGNVAPMKVSYPFVLELLR